MDLQLPLENGDLVVAAFPHRDKIFIISRFGKIWQYTISEIDNLPEIRRIP